MQKPTKNNNLLLSGNAQTGKTTQAVQWLLEKIQTVPTHQILIIVPQRTLGEAYQNAIQASVQPLAEIPIITIGGLAKRMVNLFWTDIADQAGFKNPTSPPTFLTTETAQYYMSLIVKPMLDKQMFANLTLDKNRIYSQILDNLNKAALFDFPHTDIEQKLSPVALNNSEIKRVFKDTQIAANDFREFCYQHNLLDYSLQVELFNNYLWQPNTHCHTYLTQQYRHLLLENIEEDTYITHKITGEWLQYTDSALVIEDTDGGYRKFLGADPQSISLVTQNCTQTIHTQTDPATKPRSLNVFQKELQTVITKKEYDLAPQKLTLEERQEHIRFESAPLYPQMLQWCTDEVNDLIEQGIPPAEIVILVPFLSDSLRFTIEEQLKLHHIPTKTHRPSRSLQDESIIRSLLTLSLLAHPQWGLHPTQRDITTTMHQIIDQLDPTRAHLIAKNFDLETNQLALFENMPQADQIRITDIIGERYTKVTTWLTAYQEQAPQPLDVFYSRLFGELISQKGFKFHQDFNAGVVTANIIESVKKFRTIFIHQPDQTIDINKEYITMVQEGVISAQYIRSWQDEEEQAVLLSPAFTYLLRNKPVAYQFWLDISNESWYKRLYQPLTHPEVISRHWPSDREWTQSDEDQYATDSLTKLVNGLITRCTHRIYLGIAQRNEQGFETESTLLKLIHRTLQRITKTQGELA